MEKWDEEYPEIRTYNPNPKGKPDNPILSKKMSPLTNLFLNTFWNTIEKNNLVFAIPDTVLRVVPLLTYMYAAKKKKSVIVFTKKYDNEVLHFRNYYLLNSGGMYLFEKVPLGIMSENTVTANIYLPRATNRNYKSKYIQAQKTRLLTRNEPKILLYYDESSNRVTNVIEKIILDDERIDNIRVNIDIGLIIFENVDRFIHSSFSLQIFLKWISSLLDRDIRLLFHFANPFSKYIQIIKENAPLFVLQFSPTLLKYNKIIKENSLAYFKKLSQEDDNYFINNYNIDNPFLYAGKTEIELISPPLLSGNIDEYFKNARLFLGKIDENALVHKRQYFSLINLLFKLHNLSINPSKYKELFFDPTVGYRYCNIPYMIEKIKEKISDESTLNQVFLQEIVSEIYCLYLELKECRRYGENGTYSRIAKDYQILQLLSGDFSNMHITLAAYTPIERSVLKAETEKISFDNDFDIEYIGKLSRQSFDWANTTLILPGPLRLKHMPELFRPYHKIIMLTYEGRNYDFSNEQIELYYTYSQQREDRAMEYLEEIYQELGLHKDAMFKDYYDRKREVKKGQDETMEDSQTDASGCSIFDRIEKILNFRDTQVSKEYFQEEKEAERIEQKISELYQGDLGLCSEETDEYYRVVLEKIDEYSLVNLKLPIDKTYLYLKNMDSEVQEGYPEDFEEDNYLILLGNDVRKTFLDSIIEIFGLEDEVNKYLLTLWREKLRNYINKQGLSYAMCHRKYIESGGEISYPEFLNWVKGNVYGPDKPGVLLILGKMMDDVELIDNYELINQEVENLRSIHKITGLRVRKIIKEVLRGELNQSNLSYEEYVLYEQIHNNIYRIVEIGRTDNTGENVK